MILQTLIGSTEDLEISIGKSADLVAKFEKNMNNEEVNEFMNKFIKQKVVKSRMGDLKISMQEIEVEMPIDHPL